MKSVKLIICLLIAFNLSSGQGFNHQWLLGYWPLPFNKGRLLFDNSSANLITDLRKMTFYGTQGNISDANGNLLMASNGVWIANATGDTMMNGSGINPGGITPNWPNGLPMEQNNVFIPYPGDTNKFILLHHTADYYLPNSTPAFNLFYSIIDISLDSGLGEVIIKNGIAFSDTLMWGIGICKHANGRDWWAIMMKDSSSIAHKVFINDSGISYVGNQDLVFSPIPIAASSQLTFSSDGSKFISTTYDNPVDRNSYIVISDFNRCTGDFSNTQTIQLTSGSYLWGVAFSPSGKYAYACSSTRIFQIDTDTYSVDTVAYYDGFISPPVGGFATTFWNMYLAANGKIYITSGSGVQHLHEMNYPDSAGIACDVQQHAIDLVDYLHLRAVPNHPNYYLGCDTTLGCPCLTTGIDEPPGHDFKLSVSPNPTNGAVKLIYLLPQNKEGTLEIYDLNGRRVYEMRLPPWSTLQQINVSFLSGGVYSCVVSSGGFREVRKLVVVKN